MTDPYSQNHSSTDTTTPSAKHTNHRPHQALTILVDYLRSVPAWYLATCEGDQPHVRPFSFVAEEAGRLWFCTATTKDVYRELTINPKLELTAWKPGHGWIIVRGCAQFENNVTTALQQAGFDHLVSLGETYQSPTDNTLAFFSLNKAEAWICDIDGSRKQLLPVS